MSVDRMAQREEGRRRLSGLPRLVLDVVRRVSEASGVGAADIVGRCRLKSIVHARHEVWSVLRRMGMSLPEIGSAFGVDHTSVMSGVRRWRERQACRPQLAEEPHVRYRVAVGE